LHSVVRVDLVNAKVPNTLYNITNGTNVFTFSGTQVSIPTGYYSSYGLATALVNASGGALFNMTYLPDEGRFIVYATGASFTMSANTLELQTALGVAAGTLSSSTIAGSVYASDPTYTGQLSYYKSTTLVMLNVTEYVFLDIDELRTTSVIDAKKLIGGTTDGSTVRSTFGMIPLDVPSGSIKNFKEGSDYKQYLDYDTPIPKIQRLTVRWLNSKGQSLNFQGYNNNAFTLRFHCEYKGPPPPSPPLQDVQIQRIIDAMSMVPPPPKPEPEKRAFGRWVILVLVIGFVTAYIAYLRLLKPLLERLNAVPPPQPFKPKISFT
jgi:hypothetical protein